LLPESCRRRLRATRNPLAKPERDSAKPEEAAMVMAARAVAWTGSKPLASLVDGLLATRQGQR